MSLLKGESSFIAEIKQLIPPMLNSFHKGQNGKVAVIGGSLEYTGAPYFSAMSSLRAGADLAHIICEPSAAAVIKTYSPDLIVHPLLRTDGSKEFSSQDIASKIDELLPRFHSLIIGPGLSRDPLIMSTTLLVIQKAKAKNIPMVIDADGLFLLQNNPDIFDGYKEVVLTPNIVEFSRLCQAKSLSIDNFPIEKQATELSKAYGGITILQKGRVDHAANAEKTWPVQTSGGLKRCGGQGDLLSGTLGTFLAWEKLYRDKLWDHDESVEPSSSKLLCCWASSFIIRQSSKAAFEKHGRSTQASDMIPEISSIFKEYFEHS